MERRDKAARRRGGGRVDEELECKESVRRAGRVRIGGQEGGGRGGGGGRPLSAIHDRVRRGGEENEGVEGREMEGSSIGEGRGREGGEHGGDETEEEVASGWREEDRRVGHTRCERDGSHAGTQGVSETEVMMEGRRGRWENASRAALVLGVVA